MCALSPKNGVVMGPSSFLYIDVFQLHLESMES